MCWDLMHQALQKLNIKLSFISFLLCPALTNSKIEQRSKIKKKTKNLTLSFFYLNKFLAEELL